MIRFECNQCKRPQTRSTSEAGMLIFCQCGHSMRVPWSTEVATEPVKRPILVSQPVLLEAQDVQEVHEAPPALGLPRSPHQPERLLGKVNPLFCLQHAEAKTAGLCDACRLPFCNDCLVMIQELRLCGPCKNFRLAGMAQPRRVLPLAVMALVLALCSAPAALIVTLAAFGFYQSEGLLGVAVTLCVLAMILPTIALGLSIQAIRQLEARPHAAGRGLATSAICLASVGLIWCVTVALILIGRTSGGG